MSVTVYTKHRCQQCVATTRTLDRMGVAYNSVNLDENPDKLELVQSAYGAQQAPVVVVEHNGSTESWAGFNPGKLAELG